MSVTPAQYNPLEMPPAALDAIFNEIAARVAPHEGRVYAAGIGEKSPAYINTQIKAIAYHTAVSLSVDLMLEFGAAATPQDTKAVQNFYALLRNDHDRTYKAQTVQGPALSGDVQSFNRAVELHAAVTRTLIDCIVARL